MSEPHVSSHRIMLIARTLASCSLHLEALRKQLAGLNLRCADLCCREPSFSRLALTHVTR